MEECVRQAKRNMFHPMRREPFYQEIREYDVPLDTLPMYISGFRKKSNIASGLARWDGVGR